jgi:hypothetical protein
MLLGHGAVYDEQYYTVAPFMAGMSWRDMEAWCTETFGPSTGSIWIKSNIRIPNERWYQNNGKFWFRSEADLSWFLLRWQT